MQDRHRRIVEIFLLRTAGPYMWVKLRPNRCQLIPSALLPTADIREQLLGPRRASDFEPTNRCAAAQAVTVSVARSSKIFSFGRGAKTEQNAPSTLGDLHVSA